MALVEPKLYKTSIAAASVQLQADPGEAFLVKNIMVYKGSGDYITIKIEKTTVGYFRVGGVLGSHLPFRQGRANHSHNMKVDGGAPGGTWREARIRDYESVNQDFALMVESAVPADVATLYRAMRWEGQNLNETLLSYLGKAGIFAGFPIAEGETMIVEGLSTDSDAVILIEYEQWEPGDIKPDQENGSKSKEYFCVNYGNTGAAITTAGDNIYDVSQNPAEFPDFPFGKVVPAKHNVDVVGILGSPFVPAGGDNTNFIRTKYVKLIKDRAVLFDEDRNGLLFWPLNKWGRGNQNEVAEGFSVIGGLSSVDNNPPLMFDPPIAFVPGDELSVYLTTELGGTGGTIPVAGQELGFVMKVKRVE